MKYFTECLLFLVHTLPSIYNFSNNFVHLNCYSMMHLWKYSAPRYGDFLFLWKMSNFFSPSGFKPGMVVCCCRQLPRKIGLLRAKNRRKKSYHLKNRPFSLTFVTVEQIAQSQGPITTWLPRKIIDLKLTIMSTFYDDRLRKLAFAPSI